MTERLVEVWIGSSHRMMITNDRLHMGIKIPKRNGFGPHKIEEYRWNGRYSYDGKTPIMELLELEKGV